MIIVIYLQSRASKFKTRLVTYRRRDNVKLIIFCQQDHESGLKRNSCCHIDDSQTWTKTQVMVTLLQDSSLNDGIITHLYLG